MVSDHSIAHQVVRIVLQLERRERGAMILKFPTAKMEEEKSLNESL
jgi:hypothetical protein